MASWQKRGKRSFLLVVEAGYRADGTRSKKTKTIKVDEALLKTTKRLRDYLDEELVKFKIEVEAGIYLNTEKMSFSDFANKWENKFVRKHLEQKTIQGYLFHLNKRILPYFGHMPMDKITTLHIEDFMEKLSSPGEKVKGGTLGPTSIIYYYRVLRSIFSKAKEWKVVKENPVNGVTKPKVTQKEIEVYDEKEILMVLDRLKFENLQFRILITLAITTGMRRGELLGLEWKHIDFDNGIVEVKQSIPIFVDSMPVIKDPKTKGSVRKIVLPSMVIDDLRLYKSQMQKERLKSEEPWKMEGHHFLFAHENGMPYQPKSLSEKWRSFHVRNKDLRFIRFHDLRHTAATLLINKGVHAKIISNRLGHSKIGTTMNVYGHVIESADRSAAETLNSLFEQKDESSIKQNQ